MLFGVWVTGIILRQGDGILSVRMEMVFYRSVIGPYAYLQSQYLVLGQCLHHFGSPKRRSGRSPRLLALVSSFGPVQPWASFAMPAPRRHDHLYSQA